MFFLYQGQGIFCIDVKPWRGTVSANGHSWLVQEKAEDQNFCNTYIEQIEDPIKAIMVNKETHWAQMFWKKNLNVKLFGALKSKVQPIVHYIVFIQTSAGLRDSDSP